MPEDDDYKIIYSSDDTEEFHKSFHYIRLLELNDRFVDDVNRLREKYKIHVDENSEKSLSDIEEEYTDLLSSDKFIDDVRVIARKIKLQGNWVNGLALYICGQPAGATLYPDFDLHRIEAKAVTDSDEPHLVLKIYGDMTRQDLVKATKSIRYFIEKNMDYESVNKLGDRTILKYHFIRKCLADGMDFKDIPDVLETHGFELQSYSDVRKQYHEYMAYLERIY